jgi:hypothetical protein
MSISDQDLAKLKERAAAVGLTRLTDAHLAQLKRAAEANAKNKARLTEALTVADEPAHVFSLTKDA